MLLKIWPMDKPMQIVKGVSVCGSKLGGRDKVLCPFVEL